MMNAFHPIARTMRSVLPGAAALLLVLTFPTSAVAQTMSADALVPPFSSYEPGGVPPPPWHGVIVTQQKTPTPVNWPGSSPNAFL